MNNIETLNAERDADAYIFGGNSCTLFKNLLPGELFVTNPEYADKDYCILIRTKNGYRHKIGGRQFTTGARVACYKIGRV